MKSPSKNEENWVTLGKPINDELEERLDELHVSLEDCDTPLEDEESIEIGFYDDTSENVPHISAEDQFNSMQKSEKSN